MPIPFEDECETGDAPLIVTDALVDVLGPFTGDRSVHRAVSEGWPWWYPTGADPRRPQRIAVGVTWPERASPTQAEIDRALAEAREHVAADSVECPDAHPLEAPASALLLWTAPLRSVTARRDKWKDPPSLV